MTSITKCVVLARGLGKRMRQDDALANLDSAQAAAADAGLKAMVPIGRPFLDYVLSALADAGFTQICLVIGPTHAAVREYYTRTIRPERVHVSFDVQREALGTADAVIAAEQFCGADEFLVVNSDNYYSPDALAAVQQLDAPGTVLFDSDSLVQKGNISVDSIRAFASCIVDSNGYLADIIEKPEGSAATNAKLVSMNCWRFGPAIFQACRDVPLSPRGELELPLAVKLAIQGGMKLRTAVSYSGVLDLSRRSDIAAVAARLQNVAVLV